MLLPLLLTCHPYHSHLCNIPYHSSTFIVNAFHYLGMTHHTQLAYLIHINQIRRRVPRNCACKVLSLVGKVACPSEMMFSISSSLILHGLCTPCLDMCCLNPCQEAVGGTIQVSLHWNKCALVHRQQANSRGFEGFIF